MRYALIPIIITLLLLTGCGEAFDTLSKETKSTVTVSWAANKEKDVNKSGGGYRVYYSEQPGFDISMARYVDAPYVSGPTAPTSTRLTLKGLGRYYVKVVAYSSLNPGGSEPSQEIAVTVP